MAQQVINLGATGSGAGGDSARTAFEKIIANFGELYPAALPGTAAQKAAAREMFGAENASNLTSGTLPDARVSSTLTADKAFRRGNILGTVSQSSGVPTGAIIERGSNANGEYVRFADGTQICTRQLSVPLNGAAGFATSTYPAAFVGAPSGGWTAEVPAASNVPALRGCFASTAATYWAFRHEGGGTSSVMVYLTAIGRWY